MGPFLATLRNRTAGYGAPVRQGARIGIHGALTRPADLHRSNSANGSAMNVIDIPERDLALREDIRLLGRILGETVRQQQGDAVFATVERIRQISIQFRRDDDEAARAELVATLN